MSKHNYCMPLTELSALSIMYSQPHRQYHNLNHINECLREWYDYSKVTNNTDDYLEKVMLYSIWYHDVVYNPLATDGINEAQSVSVFQQGGFGDAEYMFKTQPFEDEVICNIRATAKHIETQSNDGLEAFEFESTPLMLDIDLAGLGSSSGKYAINSLNIMNEYLYHIGLPDDAYLGGENKTRFEAEELFANGRLKFLNQLNKRETFYYHPYFHNLYDVRSKFNVAKEIELISLCQEQRGLYSVYIKQFRDYF